MAIKQRRPASGLMVHSDRGSQYCMRSTAPKAYRAHLAYLDSHQFECSMRRKGKGYDKVFARFTCIVEAVL